MRNLIYIFIIPLLITSCCDCIDNPIPESTGDLDWDLYPGDTSTYPWPTFTTNNNTFRNILLEDYTGHTCANCPSAADSAHQYELDYPGRVLVTSIHAGTAGFQAVQPPVYTTDFTTQAGDAYINEMPNFVGNPMGTINRKKTGFLNSVWHFVGDWNIAISNEITTAPLLSNLQLAYNYYPQTNGLFIHTETEFKDNLTGDYNLIIYLLRDTVIAPQTDNNGTTDYNYNHVAVLSDNINGTWGTSIATGSAANGDVFYNDFSYQLPDPAVDTTYNIDNLSLMTFLCDRNSFEVIQVIKTELVP